MKNILRKANEFITRKAVAAKVAVSNNRGEGYIDTAVIS